MVKLNVLIAGSTGYIGTQLVKLLCKHKNVKIKYLCGNTSVGKNISYYDSIFGFRWNPGIFYRSFFFRHSDTNYEFLRLRK